MTVIQPSIFLSHGGGPAWLLRGGPFTGIDAESPSAVWVRDHLRKQAVADVSKAPTALVVISAHWEAKGGKATSPAVSLLANAGAKLLYDYGGFPPEAYNLSWRASAPPAALVERARELLSAKGFAPSVDTTRGWDHGVFIPLSLAWPDAAAARLPVLQVSLPSPQTPATCLALGAALAPLRAEGALIIGSGFATHNTGEIARAMFSHDGGGSQTPVAWASEFDAWLAGALAGGGPAPQPRRNDAPTFGGAPAQAPYANVERALLGVASAPHFVRAHPTAEHLMPLLVAVGAAAPGAAAGVETPQSVAYAVNGDVASAKAVSGANITVTPLFAQIVAGTASFASWRFD